MAVVSVSELSAGRGGDIEAVRGDATRVFRVKTDNAYDSESVVGSAAGIPGYLQPHPGNFFLKCKSLKISLEHGRTIWIVKAHYDNEPIDEETRNRLIENPLLRPAKISWDSARYNKAIDKDKDGNAIVNAAGKYFDPPIEIDSSQRLASVQKNLAAVPGWLLDYENAVNESAFQIDGIQVLPRCARIGSLRISEKLEENGINYRTVDMQLEFARQPDVLLSQVRDGVTRAPASDIGGWDLILLNQGLQEVVTDDDGEPVDPIEWRNVKIESDEDANAPQPLDEDGRKLVRYTPDELIWLLFKPHPVKDYSVISALWS